jgi:hypothetical protein
MTASYNIQTNGLITRVTLEGEVNAEVLKQIVATIWAGKDYQHPCELWDFRACVAGLGPQEIKEFSHFASGNKGEREYGRIALVVEKDLHFKLSQMYERYTETLPFEIKAFRDITAAQSWLKEMS